MTVRFLVLVSLLAVIGCNGCDDGGPVGTEKFGRFEGNVIGVWEPNGRDMTLREDFAYVDPRGKKWNAPTGSVVNGASIPRAFWSITGGPFEGQYRSASVVHDVACEEMTETWQDVHRMFYEACRCGGVGERQAKTLYWAVHNFGPRWEFVEERSPETGEIVRVSKPVAPPPVPQHMEVIAEQYFEASAPSLELEEIESLTVEEIQEAVPEIEVLDSTKSTGPEEVTPLGDDDASNIEREFVPAGDVPEDRDEAPQPDDSATGESREFTPADRVPEGVVDGPQFDNANSPDGEAVPSDDASSTSTDNDFPVDNKEDAVGDGPPDDSTRAIGD